MCNYRHNDTQEIPETGKGYKLFSVNPRQQGLDRFTSLVQATEYERDSTGWVEYKKYYPGDGFCFFLDKSAALDAAAEFIPPDIEIREIEYSRGIGKHIDRWMSNQEIALCGSFRILNP